MLDKTVTYNTKMIENAKISDMLFEVYDALKERGYNPINQILGYLISGDPGYISSYKVLMCILEGYLEKWNI